MHTSSFTSITCGLTHTKTPLHNISTHTHTQTHTHTHTLSQKKIPKEGFVGVLHLTVLRMSIKSSQTKKITGHDITLLEGLHHY